MAKKPPHTQKLEEVLRCSKLVYGSFMGTDTRSLAEIIDADNTKLSKTGFTIEQIAAKMQEITNIAIAGFGTWVDIDDNRQAKVEEAKGALICPWPHPSKFAKRVTTVKLTGTEQTIKWADLSIHLIAEHNFFQGKGSVFRIEPEKLIRIIF